MTTLIAELIELARGEQQTAEPEDVRLDLVAAEAVERARRNRPASRSRPTSQESTVHGVPSTIERAVANLLDNAAKWSPPGGDVEVAVRDGEVTRARPRPRHRRGGPSVTSSIASTGRRSARGRPGSGLGLAIVRQVAEAHGGEVVAEAADGGGTRMTLRLNGSS